MLTKIRIQNFRSFKDLTIRCGAFNAFVGANSAGKTNLIKAFEFLKDAFYRGASTALAGQGGWANVRNRRSYSKKIAFEFEGQVPVPIPQEAIPMQSSFFYSIGFLKDPQSFEDLTIISERGSLSGSDPRWPNTGVLSSFHRDSEHIEIAGLWEQARTDTIVSTQQIPRPASADRLSLSDFTCVASAFIAQHVRNWRMYNVDPDVSRSPSRITEGEELWESGSNLASVLRQLSKDSALADRFLEVLKSLIPEFEGWETSTLADGRITYRVREHSIRPPFPPSSVSDGTIRLLMLLSALLNSRRRPSTVFIEEPERSLHPLVMHQLVELMREVSKDTQVFVTTHSPDFVRHCRPEEVFLMDKAQGTTRVMRASSISRINKFLEQFSLDELWTMGYLEAGIPNA